MAAQAKPIIYLDMDGVLADFIGAAAIKFDRDVEEMPPVHNLPVALDCPYEVIDRTIARDSKFWLEIPKLPWADALWRLCTSYTDTYILSRPWDDSPTSALCKYVWLRDQMGIPFDRILLTKHKHLLAGYNRILIDDYDENCKAWAVSGGIAVEFPARHNDWMRAGNDPEIVLAYVAAAINRAAAIEAAEQKFEYGKN